MSEARENFPSVVRKSEKKGLSLKFAKKYLISRAKEEAWGKSITNKIVNFKQEDGKYSWGIEYTIPLRFQEVEPIFLDRLTELDTEELFTGKEIDKLAKHLRKTRFFWGVPRSSPEDYIRLPENITTIKVLDLAPQESMHRNIRNIQPASPYFKYLHKMQLGRRLLAQYKDTAVDKAMLILFGRSRSEISRRTAIYALIDKAFGNNKGQIELFEKTLKRSKARELLIIHAHGRDTDLIGEQGWEIGGPYFDEKQALGNKVDLAQVIEKYDNPEKIASILIHTCYIGDKKPPVKSVPVFRAQGLIGLSGADNTLISLPGK